MSTRVYPYGSAQCLASAVRVMPDGDFAGMQVEIYLHLGYASSGYKSNYQRVETAWFSFYIRSVAGRKGRHESWRYSGRNLSKARRDYDKFIADLDAAIAKKCEGELTPA